MGEANTSGSQPDRVAAARRAPALSCNVCQAALPDVVSLDTQPLPGIELAFQAHCAACDQDTWAVRGTPAAVRAFYDALEKSVGQKVRLGSAKPG